MEKTVITLEKESSRDFIILNLTDPQLSDNEWADGHINRKILETTVRELIEKVKPDLVTVSGDLAWAGCDLAYQKFAELIESFGVYWSVVWGNHDNQNGAEYIEKIVTLYSGYSHFVYEKGDPELGNGNFVITIEEDGRIVESLIMMDTHDKDKYVDLDGQEKESWSKLTQSQIKWYVEQIKRLKEKGCSDATMIIHIPIYAYNYASEKAHKNPKSIKDITLEQSYRPESWNDGYLNSVGVQREGIGSYRFDDGVFDVIKNEGVTARVISGHDHVNNTIINYNGIDLIYALKTGAGCYWESWLNGGTVLKINKNGVYKVYHEYVDVSDII